MLPGLVILFITGLDDVLARAGRGIRRYRLAVALMVFVLPMEFQAVVRTFALEPSGRFPQLVAALRRHRTPGEPVYVFARTLPAWIFYSTDWARPDTARLHYLMRAAGAGGFAFENAPSRGRVRAAEVDAARLAPEAPHELLGLPSGMEWREVQEHIGMAPDSG